MLEARFWAKVATGAPQECWPWTGRLQLGYGRFDLSGESIAAHRLAYALTHGTPPDDEYVHHECENRACCNPAHLRAMTPAEHNVLHAARRASS